MKRLFSTMAFALRATDRAVLVAAMTICAWYGSTPAHAAELAISDRPAAAKPVKCQCYAVLASKDPSTGARIPKELAFMADELADDQFAAFKSFRLLEERALSLAGNAPQSAEFRTKHRLQLNLLQTESKRLKLHINLQAPGQSKPQVDLDAWMVSGGLLLFVGGAQDNGKIIFATRCSQG